MSKSKLGRVLTRWMATVLFASAAASVNSVVLAMECSPAASDVVAELESATDDFRVDFTGNMPAADLAAFYNYMATCAPQVLNPEPATLRDAHSFDESDAALPNARTTFATKPYLEAGKKLANHLNRSGGKTEFATPTLDVSYEEVIQPVRLSLAEVFMAGDEQTIIPAHWPSASEIDAACRRFALPKTCVAESDLFARFDDQNTRISVWAPIPHYDLTLKVSLPTKSGAKLLEHALEAVEKARRAPGGVRPNFQNLDRGTTPLSTFTRQRALQHYCKKNGNCGPAKSDDLKQDILTKQETLIRAKQAVHWYEGTVSDAIIENSINVRIIDPGFKTQVPVCRDERGEFIKISGACISNVSDGYPGRWESADEVWLDSDGSEKGHGLHVAYLAAGRSNQYGFNDNLDETKVTFDKPGGDADNFKGGRNSNSPSSIIVNRSYQRDARYNNDNLGPSPKAFLRSVLELQKPTSNLQPELSVIAAPAVDGDSPASCENLLFSNSGKRQPLHCLISYPYAIGVAPAFIIGDDDSGDATLNDWSVMMSTPVASSRKFDLTARPFGRSALWIAAPGENIVSKDAIFSNINEPVAIGYSARSGSSQAAAVTTSLAARLKSEHAGTLNWGQLKGWMFATATPFRETAANAAAQALVVGMLSFERALIGDPGKVNFWSCPASKPELKCTESAGDHDTADMVWLHPTFASVLNAELGQYLNPRLVAIMRARNTPDRDALRPQLYLLIEASERKDPTDISCENQYGTACRSLYKVPFPIDSDMVNCQLSYNQTSSTPRACVLAISSDGYKVKKVNFRDITHLVALPNADTCRWRSSAEEINENNGRRLYRRTSCFTQKQQ